MLPSNKAVLITIVFCGILSLIYIQQLFLNQRMTQSSFYELISPDLLKLLNNSAENRVSNCQCTNKTESITCPPIEAAISTPLPVISIDSKPLVNNRSFSEHKLWYEEKLTKNSETLPLSKYDIKTTKKILVWSYAWNGLPNPLCDGRKDWFRNYGCPVWQCEVVPYDGNRTNLNASGIAVEDFDAVVFHDPYWHGRWSLPPKRSPHQRYVFWTIEAPGLHSYVGKWREFPDFFNWTMTYRWDSDIVVPYGYTRYLTGEEIRSQKEDIKKKNFAEGKTKFAMWIGSMCDAKNGRNEYIQRLKNHIPLDVYGKCGNLTCDRGKKCREMMGRDYKFYIAFENSLCNEYVTEKMFYNPNFNVIPIVMDVHGNYDRFVPPKSFINALDFPTVKELGDYLKLLDQNDTLYNEYFWWKESYALEYSLHIWELNIYEAAARGYCGLCAKLHDQSEPVSVVKNLTKWWNDEATCKVVTFPEESGINNDTWIIKNFT